jgi:hypothetical protein
MATSPLLHVPTRKTDEAEFSTGLRAYIRSHYEQDGDSFGKEISTLSRLRQDVRGAGKDVTGRDILYRYYGQLELLDLRFPIDESHVRVLFTWYASQLHELLAQTCLALISKFR